MAPQNKLEFFQKPEWESIWALRYKKSLEKYLITDALSKPASGSSVERLFNSASDVCHYGRGSLKSKDYSRFVDDDVYNQIRYEIRRVILY
ncbi:uncharacterized protein N7458_001022 [Penicillium daleae]|uniref:HAT C-terminal dimerisation domain-containing protein n=1 Tax=Penicillium daleae TaxID=63821 RepID=A0AAD6CJL0_9EURO|nr:uncharacterized protein N7458_001022 [Penicillium daleae]KAJ5465336.1 hypothetical protein N7458_001022 [Penicillium daleae]